MNKKSVIITDSDFGDIDVERVIFDQAGYKLELRQCRTEEDIIKLCGSADGLLVQYAPMSSTVLSQLPNLRAIVRYGTGLNGIDLAFAEEKKIKVSSVPDYCTQEVAEHTIALILAATRGVVSSAIQIRDHTWPNAVSFSSVRTLKGSSLGLIGFGRISRRVAYLAQGFGVSIKVYDPYVDFSSLGEIGVVSANFQEVVACDVVSLHVPLTSETEAMVDSTFIRAMSKNSVLVNVSRGGLIDEDALLQGLSQKTPLIAALDVLTIEPIQENHPFLNHPQVILTPHIAFYSQKSLIRLRKNAAEELVDLLSSKITVSK